MALELRQNLKLSQQLVMTPQLQQAIKLLQLSRQELMDTVQEALLENPLLEERQVEQETEENPEAQESAEKFQKIDVQESSLLRNAEWEDYLGSFSSSSKLTGEREIPEQMVSFEATCAAKPSLESHLYWQLFLSHFTPEQRSIGELIIGNLDAHGYLQVSPQEIAQSLGFAEEKVLEVLYKVQEFDPVGVASRDLGECLLIQLRVQGRLDQVLQRMLQEHLQDLQEQDYQVLAKKLGLSKEEVLQYMDIIQSLDPRPGNSFGTGETFYVIPDAYVYKIDDEFVIMLNEEGMPDLQLNPQYLQEMSSRQGKTKDFLQDQLREALWLMKSLQQRQRTLYRVVESIVRFQREFFEHGVSRLRPLVLKDVAEDVEVHESTVSRITNNKYISTPYGIFELKYFFNSGLGVQGGGFVASQSVKAQIQKMISEEDQQRPLSDKKLVELLQNKLQVDIARRTVAKYREALGIPSSSKRKKRH
ncbi:MAG: RNA polymerase factor sigma-54 [Thermodesulfobacteriota bacterium]